jgi:nucleoid-associated protein YgaU
MFFKGSRYENVSDAEITDATGRIIKYKRTRFIPETPAFIRHTVIQGERLDLIAHRYYQNSELFWRICDANKAMLPDELTAEIGKQILIPPALR